MSVHDLSWRLQHDLCQAYLTFREARQQKPCPGPIANAFDQLEEALRQFGLFPSEAEEVLARLQEHEHHP
jgi:hypothetical protein